MRIWCPFRIERFWVLCSTFNPIFLYLFVLKLLALWLFYHNNSYRVPFLCNVSYRVPVHVFSVKLSVQNGLQNSWWVTHLLGYISIATNKCVNFAINSSYISTWSHDSLPQPLRLGCQPLKERFSKISLFQVLTYRA